MQVFLLLCRIESGYNPGSKKEDISVTHYLMIDHKWVKDQIYSI